MDVSSKIDLAHVSQDIVELWNEWQIRSLMLLSLLLQILLTIFGNRRKYTNGRLLGTFLWVAYLSADWVATFSLGILARSEADSANPKLIPVFWAPVLLVHLGGPGTIPVYSMDQASKLLIVRLLELVTRVGVACYVLFRLWNKNVITSVFIPIFVSGIIKYGERIWVLTRIHVYNNVSPQPFAEDHRIKIKDILPCYQNTRSKVIYLHEAHILYKTFQILSKNFDLIRLDQKFTYDLVSKKEAEEAFHLIEVELGFKYDRLYSKVTRISRSRVILRYTTFLSSISALASFSIMTKSSSVYSKNDKIISYVLLSGVVCLETYSIIMHLFSDWTMIWLTSTSERAGGIPRRIHCLSLLLTFCRKPKRYWSGSMGQHNLISAQSNNKLLKKYLPWIIGNIDSWKKVGKDLKELLFKQVKDKRSRYDPDTNDFTFLKNLLKERGLEVLRSKHCFDKLGWSVAGVEFIHSLLTWHIATHVCYLHDSDQKNGFHKKRKSVILNSTLLSDYMLYLLVNCPTMLAREPSETRYDDTRIHLRRLLLWNTHKEVKHNISLEELNALSFQEAEVKAFFKELLQSPSTVLKEIDEQGNGEKSALLDGCMLAVSLQSLERRDGWSNDEKWEMISHVWVDMLMYAASHCGWKQHTHQLARGGELLTHVCLLMAHLGLSKQCPPKVNKQLDDRSKRLAGILESEKPSSLGLRYISVE
ncbi:uncharacterized protein [Populus alba]|uniref:uncharacterized protein n=1 Tax=Populus alba TaxID=43335 RepID=UPI00158D1FD1|nr:uncharacterized protein LOC118049133 [Populus alba]